MLQDAAESSDSDHDDENRNRSTGSAARRQTQDEREATSEHSDNEDSAPLSDHDHQEEHVRAPVVQPNRTSVPASAPVAEDALSKKSLGGRWLALHPMLTPIRA